MFYFTWFSHILCQLTIGLSHPHKITLSYVHRGYCMSIVNSSDHSAHLQLQGYSKSRETSKSQIKKLHIYSWDRCRVLSMGEHSLGSAEDLLILAMCCTEHIMFMRARLQRYDHLNAFSCYLTVNDVTVTRWWWTNYVMGTQPVRRAINLGKAEMTAGPGLLTVTGRVTLGFHASLTPSRRVLCSGFLKRTQPDFPKDSALSSSLVLHAWSR